ncbi:MAG TPA: hypothetical protein VKG20_12870 [Methylomirabilota bacterium]|nr:hypothetical protein [Methylomirabilota bacterium]
MSYLTIADFKAAVEIDDTHDDVDIQRALDAATQVIDFQTGRAFVPVGAPGEVRFYMPVSADRVDFVDAASISQVAVDFQFNGTYSTVIPPTAYQLLPLNVGQPGIVGGYREVELLPTYYYTGYYFIVGQAVRLTGAWGFGPTVPPAVQQACEILANRFFNRPHAVFGIQEGAQTGQLANLSETDPDVALLLAPYTTSQAGYGSTKAAAWVVV